MISSAFRVAVPLATAGFLCKNKLVLHANAESMTKETDETKSKIKRIWSIYSEPAPRIARCDKVPDDDDERKDSELEKGIAKTRTELSPAKKALEDFSKTTFGTFFDAKKSVTDYIHWLQYESSPEVKYTVIAGGTILGFVCALRGGIIRKVIYSGIGGSIGYVIVYPAKGKYYANEGKEIAKKYGNITYNFIVGEDGKGKDGGKKKPPN